MEKEQMGPEQVLLLLAQWNETNGGDAEANDALVTLDPATLRQQAAQLAEAQAGGWVSVQERLPENGAGVMFFDREHGRCVGEFWLTDDYPHWYANWAESVEFLRVTHWQPLPAIPTLEASHDSR